MTEQELDNEAFEISRHISITFGEYVRACKNGLTPNEDKVRELILEGEKNITTLAKRYAYSEKARQLEELQEDLKDQTNMD